MNTLPRIFLQFSCILLAVAVLALPANAQNHQFSATFGGACTFSTDVSGNLVSDSLGVMISNSMGDGIGTTRDVIGFRSDGSLQVRDGSFTFNFAGVTLQGVFQGSSAPPNALLSSQFNVFVADLAGGFTVTKVIAEKNSCTAPSDLSTACGTGFWSGDIQLIPPPPAASSLCLLNLTFKSNAANK